MFLELRKWIKSLINSGRKAIFHIAPKFVNRSPFIYSRTQRLRLNTTPIHVFIHLKRNLSAVPHSWSFTPSFSTGFLHSSLTNSFLCLGSTNHWPPLLSSASPSFLQELQVQFLEHLVQVHDCNTTANEGWNFHLHILPCPGLETDITSYSISSFKFPVSIRNIMCQK